MSSDRICVGAIAGSFGVKGEVRLKSFCADPEAIVDYAPLYTEDGARSFMPTITQAIKNGFVARIPGVTSKEQADGLRGVSLFADRDKLPGLPDDEFYHADLIGLDVIDTGGAVVGQVRAVLNHGAGDLLEVHGPGLKASVLLPFTRAVVPTVDLAAGRIVVDMPEGIAE
ncbi:MAG: ribosome maturation factor RimM [Paracoccaceae bacterium]